MKVSGKESAKQTASILFSLPPCSTRSFTHIVHAPASGSLDPQRGIVVEVVNFTWTCFGKDFPLAPELSYTTTVYCLGKIKNKNLNIWINNLPRNTPQHTVLGVHTVPSLPSIAGLHTKMLVMSLVKERSLEGLQLSCTILVLLA